MKTCRIMLVAAIAAGFGCSDGQQDQEELEVAQNDQGANQQEMANEDAGDGNGQENFDAGEEGEQGQEAQQANNDQGAELNSDTSDGALSEEPPANPGAAPEGADPLADPGATNPAAAAPPGDPAAATAAAPGPEPAAASAGDTAPIPGGRVRYVPEGGVQVVSAPNGDPVVTLNQGDHPLTWEESGWLKLANGMYVPSGSLSDKGVPRPYTGNSFQN
jgi:hypothetical protein